MLDIQRRSLLKLGVATGFGIFSIPINNVASAERNVGELLWKNNRGRSPGYTSPTIINGTVYVGHRSGTDTGHLYSLDAETGDRNWVFTSYEIKSAPTVVDGTVYVTDGDLIAVDASSGNKKWEFNTENYPSSSPTVSDGTVFVGSNTVYAVDASKGEELWQFKTEGGGTTAATVNNGTVFISGSYPHRIYAINASSGEEEWHFSADDDVTAPTVANGTVYVGSNDGHVYALDAQKGTEKWQFEPEGKKREGETGEYISDGVNTIPTVADGTVYIGSNDGHVYALDAHDGTEKWRFKTEGYEKSTAVGSYFADAVTSSPTVAADTVFVGCQDNYIYALDVSNGKQKWRYDTGDNKLSAPTVVDGVVFIGSWKQENGGNLYAIDAGVNGSSEGSRVLQRTIGHHHGRADESQQGNENSADDSSTVQFDPIVHGFGFSNYSTGDVASFDEVYNVVESTFVQELQDLDISTDVPGFNAALAGGVYTALDGGLMNGHCLGMVHTARRYYKNGVPSLPEYSDPVQTAADITENPETNTALDPVEKDIDEIQYAQALAPKFGLRYLAEVFAPSDGSGTIDHDAVLETIKNRLENGKTASISMVDSSGSTVDSFLNGHQVLAYGFEEESVDLETDRNIKIKVYDPNLRGPNHDRAPVIQFQRDTTTDEFEFSYSALSNDSYNRAIYLDEAPNYDLDLFQGPNGFKQALTGGLSKFITVGVKSPVTLDVMGPDGTTVPKLNIPTETLKQATGYETLYAGFGIDPGEYSIEATGTGSGEYEIEIKGSHANGGSINDSLTGKITEGETHTFVANIPSESDSDGELSQVSDQQAGNQDITQSNNEKKESGGLPSWLPLAGGAGVLGIGGYLYKRSNSSDENQERR